MSGHNRWAQIKHQKAEADSKRGQLFSKLLHNIATAARSGNDPKFNSQLRTAIEKARENNVPHENIERAITRAGESRENTEVLILEAYGPGGTALVIRAQTDNKNRTLGEIKKILHNNGAKLAQPGSVRWAFEADAADGWKPRFTHALTKEESERAQKLVKELNDSPYASGVFINAALEQ